MNKMKKIMALLVAVVMVLGCCATAFAAKSPAAQKDAYELRFKDSYDTETDKAAADAIAVDPSAAIAQAGVSGNLELVKVCDAYVVNTTTGATVSPYTGTISGTLTGVDVKASNKVIVLHYMNGAWKQEIATAGNGSVSMTLNGCSPIAVLVDVDAVATTAPKTGEAPVATVLMTIMALAAAGMFFSRKRSVA